MAGIVSYVNTSIAKLINNENYGNVTVKSFNESTNASSYYNIASIAGICAYKYYDILLYDCKNKGNITIEDATNSKKRVIYIAGIAGISSGSTERLSEKLYNYGKITVKNSASIVYASGCVSGDSIKVGEAINRGNIEVNSKKDIIVSGINNGYRWGTSDLYKGEKINYGDISAISESGNIGACGISSFSQYNTKLKNYGNLYVKGKNDVIVRGISGSGYTGDYNECFNKGNITVEASTAKVSGLTEYGNSFNNCYNEGNIEIISNGDVECAGIAPRGSGVINSNCYNSGDINIYSNGTTSVTGLIFDCSGIKDSYNKGNISVVNNGNTYISGIGITMSDISNCYNVGNMNLVTTKSSYNIVSGISFNSNRPVNCYNEGNITVINGGESTWVDPIRALSGAYNQSLRSCEFV